MPNKSPQRACPVCGTKRGEVLHHQVFASYDESPLPLEYDVVSCTSCGFTFADTPASQAQYDKYYRRYSKYQDELLSSGFGQNAWDFERLRQTASDIARLIPHRDSHLLDVGSAGGGLLNELKRRGYRNLSGLDHATTCTRDASYRAYRGGITTPPETLIKQCFDGIFLSHVLEHVRDLRGTLSQCAALLGNKGVLYLETPDAERYAEFSKVPYYFFDCEHINHFSLRSLRNLAEQFGLRFVSGATKSYMASSLDLYPAVWAAFTRDTRHTPADTIYDGGARNGVINHINASKKSRAMPDIEVLAQQCTPVIVWGAGSFAQRLLENSPLSKCRILYFIDNDPNKQGKRINGHDIQSPDSIAQSTAPIIICAALFGHDIENQIRALRLDNPIIQMAARH